MARRPHATLRGAPAVNPALAWGVTAVSLIVLLMALIMPLWLPRLVRLVIPDRYVVAYAPAWFQEIVFNEDNRVAVPTVAPVAAAEEQQVLGELAALAGGTATAAAQQAAAPTTEVTATPPPTLTPTPTVQDQVLLTGFTVHHQMFNRCGPATLSMALSYWGRTDTQVDINDLLMPLIDDSNFSPDEMVTYVEHIGLAALHRVDGDLELLKRLLNAGYPVIIERGFDELPDEGWMAHYMLMVGYSQTNQEFYALDSFWASNRSHSDSSFPIDTWGGARLDELWRHFERTYIVVYPPGDAAEVASLIGDEMDDSVMNSHALITAQAEATRHDDEFAWYNVGAALTRLGDYSNAAIAFDAARSRILPFRMYWYRHEIYEAYYRAERYSDVLSLAAAITDVTNYPESEEAFYYMGLVYEAQGEAGDARNAYQRALRFNPTYAPAQERLAALGG